jgi:hypothetical protein
MAQTFEGDENHGPTPSCRQMTKRRRHHRELPALPPPLLLNCEGKGNDNGNGEGNGEDGERPDQHRGRKVPSIDRARKMMIPLFAMMALVILSACTRRIGDDGGGGGGGGGWPESPSPGTSRYGPPMASSSEFVSRFELALLNDDLGRTPFVPLVLEGGRLLCRGVHRDRYSRLRTRFFVQMVRKGLSGPAAVVDPAPGGGSLPILAMDGDENGCNVVQRRDEYQGRDIDFPRFAWSTLSYRRHGWRCHALSMPSYETWKYYRRSRRTAADWERAFEDDGRRYPWPTKVRKAVWRGSTTYEGHQYHGSELGETPRGRLVKTGMERPELIDAAFHKIDQKFRGRRKELAGEFRVAGRISLRDMMKYMGMRALL